MSVTDRDCVAAAIAAKREAVVLSYLQSWETMIEAWRLPRTDDAVWLLYSANYLFNTRGLRWAVDPVLLGNRVPEAPVPDAGRDLADLDFIVLTHAHADHIDVNLWHQLRELRCQWIVPDHMVDFLSGETGIVKERYTIAVPGHAVELAGVRIMPFASPHYETHPSGKVSGVPSTGYLIEIGLERYLFPGDVRTYDPNCMEAFVDISAVFAHVFLGRSAALLSDPPLLQAFIDFHLSVQPRKIVLSHLHEFGRVPEECWLPAHARRVAEAIGETGREIRAIAPEWYEETLL